MLARGKAKKVTIYLNADTSSKGGFEHEEILKFLYEQEVAGAAVIRLDEGFGSHHQRQGVTHRHLGLKIEFIDSIETVEALLPALLELVPDGLVEVQETTIVKAARQEAVF